MWTRHGESELTRTWELCNIRYPSQTLKPKSREISFANILFISYPIVLKFCTEHGSDTAVLCAKFQNDWTTKTAVMDDRDFARFEFNSNFRRMDILYCTAPQAVYIGYVGYSTQTHLDGRISRNLVYPLNIGQLSNRFEILHRARQRYCRTLCKISQRLSDSEISSVEWNLKKKAVLKKNVVS